MRPNIDQEIEVELLAFNVTGIENIVNERYSDRLSKVGIEKLYKRVLECYIFFLIKTTGEELNNYYNIFREELKNNFDFEIEKNRFYYKDLVNILDELQIIQINNKYSNLKGKEFSKAYRMNTTYTLFKGYETQKVKVNLRTVFNYKRSNTYFKELVENNIIDQAYIDNVFSTKIDIEAMSQYYKNNYNKKLKTKTNKYGDNEDVLLNEQKFEEVFLQAVKINLGFYYITSPSESRVYTNFTNLPSWVEPFIYNINEPEATLISKDGVNMQPAILTSLIDSKAFTELCDEGQIYETVEKQLNISRDQAKVVLYSKILFNNKKLSKNDTELKDCLNNIDPTLVDQINKLKEKGSLAALLQKRESEIFIYVSLQLNKLGIWNMTKHDSILFDKKHEQTVTTLLLNRFEHFNVRTKLK